MRTYINRIPLLLIAVSLFLFVTQIVQAQVSFPLATPVELGGYIWSGYDNGLQGIGWVSMSCINTDSCSDNGGIDYGVTMDEDGNLNGYAWSPNVGWMQFGGFNTSQFPSSDSPVNAQMDEDGNLKGWARFIAADQNNTGWRGWVRLDGPSYGVRFDVGSGEVMDGDQYAWGSYETVGWLDFSGVVLGATPTSYGEVDLTVPNLSFSGAGTPDRVNGRYSTMRFPFVVQNVGEDSTPEGEGITWLVSIEDTIRGNNDESTNSVEPGPLAGGANLTINASVSDFIYGVYEVNAAVNGNRNITELNYDNNDLTSTFTIRPPDPGIQLSAERDIIRTGDTANITWDVVATYPMECIVSGPGISYSFDPSIQGPTGERETTPRTNASIYTVTCNEPMTDTTFTSGEMRIEVVPQIQEL